MIYLSIITITYNNKKGFLKTMDSILPLPDNCEWIIIDGNSSDGTKEVLNTIPKHENIKWISEIDRGIYDAMNKGINFSTGKYLNFMNSGDTYIRNNFIDIIKSKKCEHDIIMYDCQTITDNQEISYVRQFPKSIDEIKNWACVQHQSTLISKKVFDKLGLYSMEYKYLSDYEHSVKAYLDNDISFKLYPDIKICYFLVGGVSTNLKTTLVVAKEYKAIQKKYFGKYNKKLLITNYLKYFVGFLPFNNSIMLSLRKIFLNKR